MKRFTVLLAIMCVVLTGCQLVTVTEEIEVSATVTKTQYEVCATVTKMQYEASYTTLIPLYNAGTNTTTLLPITHPAQYLVTITYESVSEIFDDQTLYESVKEGDTIQMILCNDFDKENNLIRQTLLLPE